nr:MAG TPA: hypothetical protein [Caudoviricetes sp.]
MALAHWQCGSGHCVAHQQNSAPSTNCQRGARHLQGYV